MLKYSLFILNVIKCYLMACFVEHQVDVIIMGVLQNISLQLCPWLALWGVLHRYLFIICYDDVIFNFYYFITALIGKTCSMSLMRFSNRTFYKCFIFLLTLSKFSQCFKILMLTIETVFLTNIVNKACTGFYTLKMVSGKKTEMSVEKNFRFFVFIYQ